MSRWGTVARLLASLAAMALVLAGLAVPWVVGAGLLAAKASDHFLDARCDVVDTPLPQRSTLFAADGHTVIATLFTQNRSPVLLSQVPEHLVQALVDTEDRRFYQHHGVDMRGVIRAAAHNASGSDMQGGSTLTMQYIKQERYYQAATDAERQAAIAPNLARKLADARCALDLEKRFTKQQILEKYLNIAFFGENSYGIATAAETYFGTSVSELTVPQAALLVGLVRAPSQYDPYLDARAARARRDEVMQNMVSEHHLSAADAARYMATPIRLATVGRPPVRQGCAYANPSIANAGFFCDYTVNWLLKHGLSQQLLDSGGLRVVTTLNASLQASAQKAIWARGLRPTNDYALVMPSVDPRTGEVTSMISSRRYGVSGAGRSSDPLFTAAYAGAGSTYKYFSAVAALTAGAPLTLSLTTPGNSYTTRNCRSGHYTVRNAGQYASTLPLSSALPQSSNTYFVALEDQFFGCRLGPIVDTALSLGMDRLRAPLNDSAAGSIAHEVVNSQEPTFTLGQEPTSALELTAAFAAAANDGTYCPPVPVRSVTDPSGKPWHIDRPACQRAISRSVARTVMKLMRADTHTGTASSYFRDWYAAGGSDIGGKTGTDNDASDTGNSALWFVGMTP
ncbi:MAG TPA: transglycosylase domain-containing protein, partial [Jatrophihabitantaceae bacterium]|nr:transglycosylase domain-containing protein [Jatrophihabitantaceae bacterium]